ncbi:hypothetical protein F5877DRAFT_86453 [Lentinula edodes]|nr:hypothetical protein F5877DRAFT_86453 [Lentinula edodes]
MTVLLDKSSESVWRMARANVDGDMPLLPNDLNEIQYAHLIFDQFATNLGNAIMFCGGFALDAAEIANKLVNLKRMVLNSFPLYNWQTMRIKFHPFRLFDILPKEKIKSASKDVHVVIFDHDLAVQLKAQFLVLQSEEDRCIWLNQKREEHREIENKSKRDQRLLELYEIRKQRMQGILTRLGMIGWRDEAELILSDFRNHDTFANHCLINQAKNLTDHIWANIEPELLELLSEHKARRLEQEHIQNCHDQYSLLREEYLDILSHEDLREPFPGLHDILTDSVFQDMIFNPPKMKVVTPTYLRTMLLAELPRILNEWRPAKLQSLLEIVKQASPGATAFDLRLATTIFGCAKCNGLFIFPQMFYHGCCFQNRVADGGSRKKRKSHAKFWDTVKDSCWSSVTLFFHSQSSQLARRIVVSVGLNPATATACDLSFARPVIENTSEQANTYPARLFVMWPAALTHNLTVQDEIFFAVNYFGAGESSEICAKEPLSFDSVFCCAHCHEETIPRSLARHLQSVHNLKVLSALSTATQVYTHFKKHWYWNPRHNLNLMGVEFSI